MLKEIDNVIKHFTTIILKPRIANTILEDLVSTVPKLNKLTLNTLF